MRIPHGYAGRVCRQCRVCAQRAPTGAPTAHGRPTGAIDACYAQTDSVSPPRRTPSPLVSATARAYGEHVDAARCVVTLEADTPVAYSESPLRRATAKTSHVARRQAIDRGCDPLSIGSAEPSEIPDRSWREDDLPAVLVSRHSAQP